MLDFPRQRKNDKWMLAQYPGQIRVTHYEMRREMAQERIRIAAGGKRLRALASEVVALVRDHVPHAATRGFSMSPV